MYIGRYYIQKEKWIAAINRFRTVIDLYDTTIYSEEALHRLVEIHYYLGLKKEAERYANLLGYNYQSSEWYKKSYSIFNLTYEQNRKQLVKKNKKSKKIIEKIKSLINWDEKNIEKLYKQKINLIKKYNKNYFEKSTPIVTDEEYDKL